MAESDRPPRLRDGVRLEPAPAYGPDDEPDFFVEATRRLSPLVVEFGADAPLLDAYASELVGKGRSRALVLDPIDASRLPEAPAGVIATLRSADPALPYVVSNVRLSATGRCQATASLARAVVEKLPRRRAARFQARPEDPLVLVAGVDELDAHIFPIVDIGGDGCAVESAVPLGPGDVLDPVFVARDRRTLRRARATVLGVVVRRSPEGKVRYHCRLSLEESRIPDTAGPYDVLSEPARVLRVMDLAGALGVRARLVSPQGSIGVLLGPIHDAQIPLTIAGRHEAGPRAVAAPRSLVRVAFDLFDVRYEADVRVVPKSVGLSVTLPLIVRRRRRRQQPRVPVPPSARVSVSFRHPVTRARTVLPVTNLSAGGLAFTGSRVLDMLWRGMPLDDAELHAEGVTIGLGPLEVRATHAGDDELACHVAFLDGSVADDPKLIALLASLRYPSLRVHDGRSFPEMLALYTNGGLLGPHMARNLPLLTPAIASGWRKLHHAPDLAQTLVRIEGGQPVAAVSGVRCWEGTWSGQHMVALPGRKWREPAALHTSFVDHVLAREEARAMVVFVRVGNEGASAFFQRFLELEGSPEVGAKARLGLWSLAPDAGTSPDVDAAISLRALRRGDEAIVARGAERALGAIPASALSFVEGELSLPKTRKAFAAVGLVRERRVEVLTKRGRVLAAVCEEKASPGVNLTFLLNATWILPVHDDLFEDAGALRAAVHAAMTRPPQTATGERFLVAPERVRTEVLRDAGYQLEAHVDAFSYNRAGLLRWYHYVHRTYGERAASQLRRAEEEAS